MHEYMQKHKGFTISEDILMEKGEVSPMFSVLLTCRYNNRKVEFKSNYYTKKKIAKEEAFKMAYDHIMKKKSIKHHIEEQQIDYKSNYFEKSPINIKTLDFEKSQIEKPQINIKTSNFERMLNIERHKDDNNIEIYSTINYPSNIYLFIDLDSIDVITILRLQFIKNINISFICKESTLIKYDKYMKLFEKNIIKVKDNSNIIYTFILKLGELLRDNLKNNNTIINEEKIIIVVTDKSELFNLNDILYLIYDNFEFSCLNIEKLHKFLLGYF